MRALWTARVGGEGKLRFGGVRVLVGAPVFKTGEAENLGLAGSIPVRLRHRERGAKA